ncbi:glycosyltransferase family 2 protein [Paracraurococcus lichenis]|uniref:Glycosyltransferase family 2 protein n=1 Tax=Paracraurococcus lichenis TaxID=3064888 RepID=A0ABT9E2S4_9PROT|nr:glycosyltransferase family 2 protein [Paracraurococcus sp. LOR1-02]MDO9710397.1 glycosyltransferase family 2 protein [Paracraurococcus sp. LOR1-02]
MVHPLDHAIDVSSRLLPGGNPAPVIHGLPAMPRVSVVLPTLNEAQNLRVLLPLLPNWLEEVVIVDGHSTDGTVETARAVREGVQIVQAERRGKGAALRAGFRAARGDIIIALDADCSMHPREIVLMVGALLAGGDFVKGSRFIQGGGTDDMSAIRRLGNWGLTQAVRLLYGGTFSDLCYGYFGFWRRHAELLEPTCDGFEVETYLNLQALRHRLKVIEVPSFEAPRLHGKSNLRALPDGWRVLKTIVRERVRPVAREGYAW